MNIIILHEQASFGRKHKKTERLPGGINEGL